MKNIAVIGSSGAIGGSLVKKLSQIYPEAYISAFSRSALSRQSIDNITFHQIDYLDETSIANGAQIAATTGQIELVIVATGILHNQQVMPEKSIRDITFDNFQHLFAANTIFPALVAKHFLPQMAKDSRNIFAALSARVGSISDNRLGGWYSYRASKAALNMVIKNLAIERKIANKQAIIVGLHPGTVNSKLSKPFQANISEAKLFTPEFSAEKMLLVLDKLTPADSGKCFAWDGKEILP